MYEPLTVLRRTPSASAATAATPSAVPAAAPCRQTTTPDSLTTSSDALPGTSTSPTQPGGTVTLSRSSPAERTSHATAARPRAVSCSEEARGHIDAVRCDEVLDGQRRHGEAVGRSERHEQE